uniref:t-SNARE coiled-coil homology domain-containing protein n=1 Tax=Chenopodium quinoa TaxID=63459 RepID=A0A803KSR7_CHEQI
MSFADLEAGRPLPSIRRQQQQQDPSQAVAAGIFKINTAVSSFQRLVNTLGTPKDTLDLRDRLHKTRLHIGQLVKETSAKLKEASETDQRFEVGASKKIADAKLARDFQTVLKEFQKAQRLAAQRETAYSPFVPKEVSASGCRSSGNDEEISSFQRQEQQSLLLESRRQEVVHLDNELVFNEAIIEEREHGIQEIQQQIGEVNEIFKDLAVLVHDQGVMIGLFALGDIWNHPSHCGHNCCVLKRKTPSNLVLNFKQPNLCPHHVFEPTVLQECSGVLRLLCAGK